MIIKIDYLNALEIVGQIQTISGKKNKFPWKTTQKLCDSLIHYLEADS